MVIYIYKTLLLMTKDIMIVVDLHITYLPFLNISHMPQQYYLSEVCK